MKYTVLLLSVCLMFSACKKPQAPVFKDIKNLQIGQIQGDDVLLMAEAHYFNPNNMRGQITGADIDIGIKGKKVGVVNQTSLVKIPANSSFIIPLEARLSTQFLSKDLLGNMLSILQAGKVPLHIQGAVYIKIAGISRTIPVNHIEEISLKKLLF